MTDEQIQRAKVLLTAARNLLVKQKVSGIVLNLLEETVPYDGTDCDGYCLIDDIDAFFEEIADLPEAPDGYEKYRDMKLRDIVKDIQPNKVASVYEGGVSSCPTDYIWDSSYCLCKSELGPTASCSDCWDQIHEGTHKSRKD